MISSYLVWWGKSHKLLPLGAKQNLYIKHKIEQDIPSLIYKLLQWFFYITINFRTFTESSTKTSYFEFPSSLKLTQE